MHTVAMTNIGEPNLVDQEVQPIVPDVHMDLQIPPSSGTRGASCLDVVNDTVSLDTFQKYATDTRAMRNKQGRKNYALHKCQERRNVDKRRRIQNTHAFTHSSSSVDKNIQSVFGGQDQRGQKISLEPHVAIEEMSGIQIPNIPEYSTQLCIPTTTYILPGFTFCKYCGAKKFHTESKGFCCSDGKVRLHSHNTPDDLFELFTSNCPESTHFRPVCRTYNNHFAFTSFGVKYDKDLCKSNKGIYTFRVQGQVYHYINPLLPRDDKPSYMQLYFYDTENELQNRLQNSDKLLEAVLLRIIHNLKMNPYSRFFRSLNDYENLHDHRIQIRCHPGLDQRVYNTPTASQVAAIWVEEDPSASVRVRDISIYGHSGEAHRVHYYYGCYDPLQYPLLFPYGEPGWHEGIERSRNANEPHCVSEVLLDVNTLGSSKEIIQKESEALHHGKKRFQISCREYYCYKFQIRPQGKSLLLHTGRLFQQYVVDMYVKIETTRLDYFRNNQKQIRAELYGGIVDSIENGENRGNMIGKKMILPQSFTCGPRDMQRRYRDAMALVQRFGKPDVFLTMTCNPNWPEIKQELKYCDEAQNRPDLIARVFKAKLDELKNDLVKEHVLSPVAAYIYVIEFQKRGLPHAHFLLIFKNGHKVCTSNQVDNIVSCELPDQNLFPHLHSTVVKHMMHGPCGLLNPKNVCMDTHHCCKNKYPRDYSSHTLLGNNSYPIYKRRPNGHSVKVRGHLLDNRWVVPHNRYLTAKFDCHINVEICSSVKAVKYLYKYVYKGHDRVNFSMSKDQQPVHIDEISEYQSARWISPPEAIWRLFSFTLSEIYPTVVSLQLHLQDQQLITYSNEDDLSNLLNQVSVKRTMLTEFFLINKKSEFARTLLYRDFPKHFVWNANRKIWTTRKKQTVIGRVVAASPNEGERYFLRVLLNHIKGPQSFEDLKTINGVIVLTYMDC